MYLITSYNHHYLPNSRCKSKCYQNNNRKLSSLTIEQRQELRTIRIRTKALWIFLRCEVFLHQVELEQPLWIQCITISNRVVNRSCKPLESITTIKVTRKTSNSINKVPTLESTSHQVVVTEILGLLSTHVMLELAMF